MLYCPRSHLCPAFDAYLVLNCFHVDFNCCFSDAEFVRDDLVRRSIDKSLQDHFFTRYPGLSHRRKTRLLSRADVHSKKPAAHTGAGRRIPSFPGGKRGILISRDSRLILIYNWRDDGEPPLPRVKTARGFCGIFDFLVARL